MSTHAVLSPSSASRWLACTPSARLEKSFADTSGDAAAEGTLAHKLSEILIGYKLRFINATYHTELALIQANKFYSVSMHSYCEDYSNYVIERFNAAKAHTPDAKIELETFLDMSDYVPEGYGTGDVAIAADYMAEFIDLKFGKGVQVFAKENKQMMLYALGLLKRYSFLYGIKVIRMTIYQPRMDNISTWEISVENLLRWANDTLRPKARLAFDGKGEFIPGEHCRFCKVKARCKALADYNLEIAKDNFPDGRPELVSDELITKILSRAKDFESWIKAVKEFALTAALKGRKWPGYKLVKSKGDRVITDKAAVGLILLQEPDLTREKLYKPEELQGITALEAVASKKRFEKLVGQYIIRPDAAPVLVPESDERPAMNSADEAQKVFAHI